VNCAFKYSFDVYGKTPFPMLMLSMEGCFPSTAADGAGIMESNSPAHDHLPLLEDKVLEREQSRLNLTIITTDRAWQPKIGHWNKFGWTVGTIRTEYNERTI